MILVQGWVKLAAGEIDKLHDAAAEMLEKTRAEKGCVEYTFARSLDDPDTLRIAECWESEAALDAHGKSEHMAAFNKAMGGAQILGISLKRYKADDGTTLMGE